MGELAAIASAFLGTLSTILMKQEGSRVSAVVLTGQRGVFGCLFYWMLLGVGGFWTDLVAIPWATVGVLVASTLIGQVIGDTLFFRSVAAFGVARTMPFVSSFPLVTTFLAVTILDEPLGWERILGVFLVVGGLIFLTEFPEAQGTIHRGRRLGRIEFPTGHASMWLLLAPALTSGISVFLLKPVLATAAPIVVNAIRQPIIAVVLMGLALSRGLAMQPDTDQRRYWTQTGLGHLLGVGISSLLFLTGIQLAGAARGGTLASVGPLFALLLSPLLLKERITRRGALGSVLTVAGVWLLI